MFRRVCLSFSIKPNAKVIKKLRLSKYNLEFYSLIRIFAPMKLSIIIPVYRVEATLNRCIESVLNQNLDDFEVILIDDGSPDNCPQICDDWAHKDSRILVIHKYNGGLSDARNAGIEQAQGEYITFVDSDDFVAGNTYAPLIETLASDSTIDIIEYPIRDFDFNPPTVYTHMDDYWYSGKAYLHTYACNKIFSRTLFADVRFPEGRVFEDVYTLPQLLKKAHKVMTTNRGFYHYCYNPEGITAKADGKALKQLLKPHADIIRNSTRGDAAFQQYYMHVLNIQMDVFELTGETPILPTCHISMSNVTGISKLKALALHLLGIKTLCKLNKIIHRVWRNH